MNEQTDQESNFAEEDLIPIMKVMLKKALEENENVRLMPPLHFSLITFDERENPIYKLGDEYQMIQWQLKKLTKDDLRKFCMKHLILADDFQTDKIYSFIIYSEEIEEDIIYKTGQCCFKPEVFSLKQLDGDKILNDIKIKIENNEELNENIIDLSLLSFYKSKRKPEEILYETCSLTKQIKNIEQEELEWIQISHLVFIDKFVQDDDEKKKYFEEMGLDSDSLDSLMGEKEKFSKYFNLNSENSD